MTWVAVILAPSREDRREQPDIKQQGGSQPKDPAQVERPDVEPAAPLDLHDHLPGDQETADDEEDQDAQSAGHDLSQSRMAQENQADRDRPESVQGRQVIIGCPPARDVAVPPGRTRQFGRRAWTIGFDGFHGHPGLVRGAQPIKTILINQVMFS